MRRQLLHDMVKKRIFAFVLARRDLKVAGSTPVADEGISTSSWHVTVPCPRGAIG